jgi:hypothetical protein
MNFKRVVAAALAVAFAFILTATSAFASQKTDVVAAVHQYFDNLDKDKLQMSLAVCDSNVSILDEFPPHVWQGATACADWFKEWDVYNQKNGITDPVAVLGTPWSVDVNGDRAYLVAPATYAYKQHGKPVKELHSVFTVALRRVDAGWRITAWSWSKH